MFELLCWGEEQEGILWSAAEVNPSSVIHVFLTGIDSMTIREKPMKVSLVGVFSRKTAYYPVVASSSNKILNIVQIQLKM